MKKIIFVSPKETIQLSYPDWASSIMKLLGKYLIIKTVKLKNDSKVKKMYFDEII
jgi:hypothetical protein